MFRSRALRAEMTLRETTLLGFPRKSRCSELSFVRLPRTCDRWHVGRSTRSGLVHFKADSPRLGRQIPSGGEYLLDFCPQPAWQYTRKTQLDFFGPPHVAYLRTKVTAVAPGGDCPKGRAFLERPDFVAKAP